MKKIIVMAALLSLLLSNIALAKFSDEYKRMHPDNVTVTTEQAPSGKMVTTTTYKLFRTGKYINAHGLSITLHVTPEFKVCFLSFYEENKFWKFYDGMIWGDGQTAHNIPLFKKPLRKVERGFVRERITAEINPSELKKAVAISVHSERDGTVISLNQSNPLWPAWKNALDAAEKIMSES